MVGRIGKSRNQFSRQPPGGELPTLSHVRSHESPTSARAETAGQSLGWSLPGIRGRIGALVEIAAANQSTISLEELRGLVSPGFPNDAALVRFLETDERLARRVTVVGKEVAMRGREDLAAARASQRDLTHARLGQADSFLDLLSKFCPWVDLAGVSGSTAYAGAKPDDDIDFFLVTAERRSWISLLLAMATARLGRLRSRTAPQYCFNRIIELEECVQTFRDSRDALLAREALNLVVLRGNDVYWELLTSAPWIGDQFPELYETRRSASRTTCRDTPQSLGLLGDALNAAAFMCLAPYLWLAGLLRNVGLKRAGRDKECFRTIIRPDSYATESTLYDELREAYRQAFA